MKSFIPENLVEEIRRNSDIVEVLSEYMLLTKKGRNYFGLCPFHGEKTPSFSVSPDKQIFHCFGCAAGGNVFNFVMQKENLSFPETVELLASRAGIEIPQQADERWNKEKQAKLAAFEINHLAANFYHYILGKMEIGGPARDYLKTRGLSAEIVQQFQLGYAPNAWESLKNFLAKKNYTAEELAKIGLTVPRASQTGYYDRFRHRLMFPIWDVKSNVIGFGGRILAEGEPKYLNSPESFIYNKRENLYALNFAAKSIRELDQAIIAEGYMDVITAHQFGIKNVVASLGTALTKEQVKLLMRYSHQVIVAYDADNAGVKATLRGIEVLQSMGCKVKILTIPNGKDPDEFIRNKGPHAFNKLVTEALPLVEYKLQKAVEEHGLKTPEAKAKIVEELSNDLASISSEVERELYFKKVATSLGLQVETIFSEVRKQQRKGTNNWQNRDKFNKNRNNTGIDDKTFVLKKEKFFSGRTKAEAFLLRMVLEAPELWSEVKLRLGSCFFSLEEYNQIAKAIDNLIAKNPSFESAEVYNYLQEDSNIKALNKILALELPLNNMEATFADCIDLIEKEIRKEQRDQLVKEIAQAEKEGDFNRVKQLMVKLKEISTN